jgi:hypothetical protein
MARRKAQGHKRPDSCNAESIIKPHIDTLHCDGILVRLTSTLPYLECPINLLNTRSMSRLLIWGNHGRYTLSLFSQIYKSCTTTGYPYHLSPNNIKRIRTYDHAQGLFPLSPSLSPSPEGELSGVEYLNAILISLIVASWNKLSHQLISFTSHHFHTLF